MKRLVRILIVLLFPLTSFSQKEYFIYLQSEAEQPFFARMGENTFSSSATGYLILSKLKDTVHTLVIGFPQNKWPEQRFELAMGSRDRGFLLKNFPEKGWGLFDLQTLGVIMGSGSTAANRPVGSQATVSLFTEILSKAANDPSLKEKPVFAAVVEKKTGPGQAPVPQRATVITKAESVTPVTQVADTPGARPASLAKQEPAKDWPARVVKTAVDTQVARVSDTLQMTEVAGIADETRPNPKQADNQVVIPDTPNAAGNAKLTAQVSGDSAQVNTPALAGKEPVKEQQKAAAVNTVQPGSSNTPGVQEYVMSEVIKKSESSTTDGYGVTFIDKIADFRQDTIQIFIPNSRTILGDARKKAVDDRKFLDITDADLNPKKGAPGNNCPAVASESDFFRLRKKMAGEKESESMISEAKKEFRARCFSVDQIRNLGNLFLNEAGKYQFYEVAYASSSDKNGFSMLQAEFKDPYFIHRFKNLVD